MQIGCSLQLVFETSGDWHVVTGIAGFDDARYDIDGRFRITKYTDGIVFDSDYIRAVSVKRDGVAMPPCEPRVVEAIMAMALSCIRPEIADCPQPTAKEFA